MTVDALPVSFSIGTLREALRDRDLQIGMVDSIEKSREGTEVLLPISEDVTDDGEPQTHAYVWDGRHLLFRGDTKAAEMLRRKAKRRSRKRV